MPTLSSIRCPHCGFPNIPENDVCTRCHTDLFAFPLPLPNTPATGETVTLYHDETGTRWLTLSRSWLEYAAPDIVLRTPWTNLASIHHPFWASEYYLYMFQNPTILRANWRYTTHSRTNGSNEPVFGARGIDLHQFGFPEDKVLGSDLCRYAPQLYKYMPN